jgi:uncharacterized protein
MSIDSLGSLREIYGPAKERSVKKQIDHLDRHCIRFISLSPFVVLASASAAGAPDASPRGGAPGFVHVVDAHTLLIPDSPGNNRLDTLTNLAEAPKLGLLFMIPGMDETLRVNGVVRLRNDESALKPFADDARIRVAIEVTVTDAYLHCAKAFMRSKLWDTTRHIDRATMPTMGEMLNEQTGTQAPPETREDMLARYARDL